MDSVDDSRDDFRFPGEERSFSSADDDGDDDGDVRRVDEPFSRVIWIEVCLVIFLPSGLRKMMLLLQVSLNFPLECPSSACRKMREDENDDDKQ